MAERRRSRALVRMMSSSFWTVAASHRGFGTQVPFCSTLRLAATRSASARKSSSRIVDRELHPLARSVGVGIPVGYHHAARRVRLSQRHERERFERRAPEIGIDADLGDLGRGIVHCRALVPPAAAWARPVGAAVASRARPCAVNGGDVAVVSHHVCRSRCSCTAQQRRGLVPVEASIAAAPRRGKSGVWGRSGARGGHGRECVLGRRVRARQCSVGRISPALLLSRGCMTIRELVIGLWETYGWETGLIGRFLCSVRKRSG